MACTAFGRSLEAAPFPHRNFATNPDVIGIVNDAIHDCFRYRAVIIRIGIDAFIPTFHLVLCAEDNGTFLTVGFDNLKQIIGFLWFQGTDQPFVENQQFNLLVGLNSLSEGATALGNIQIIQQFRHPDVADGFEFPAGGITQSIAEVGFSIM